MDQITLVEASKRLHVSAATLRAQIHRGKLRATKLGRDWLVEEAEVDRYREESQQRRH